ncbi:GGDEF domain-containing protein [Neptunomonas phycophila]|uniref:GGDEF domain-containing protein n=1 Tax=Neptunomonas phycophila TaxID=1572645 RepID=UPI003BAAAF5B
MFSAILFVMMMYIKHLKRLLKQTEQLSLTDELTQLHNRRSIVSRAREEIANARRFDRPFTIAICDIDRFKRVNDTFGHDVGDEVLVSVANVLRESVRETDFVGRMGGEEFAILLPNTECSEATVLLDRIATKLRTTDVRSDLFVTMSIGTTCLNEDDTDFVSLMKRADNALYTAKLNGRDRLVQAEDIMRYKKRADQ